MKRCVIILEKLYSQNGVSIFNIPQDKFKTNTINIFFVDNLSKENVAKNALMLSVLKRGTKNYPKTLDLKKKQEELYGLSFGCDVYKKGETQVLQFHANVIDNRFTPNNENLINEAFLFIKDIILNPYIVNGLFNSEYIETEKSNIIKLIESKINDKMYYATQSLIENMCSDELFGIFEYGNVEDYGNITDNDLIKNYYRMLNNMPMYIFVSGNVSNEQILDSTKCFRELKRGQIIKINRPNIKKTVLEEKMIIDSMDIIQDKFCMGFRTNIEPQSKEYVHLMVYNSILGGGMTSKLFSNVREKNGLCYYIYSNLIRYKGIMIISTGIDAKNKDKVKSMILKEMDNMKAGNITELEREMAIRRIKTSLMELKDTQYSIADFNLTNVLFESNISIEDFIELINDVTTEDIVRVSKNIVLDTEYLLTSNN